MLELNGCARDAYEKELSRRAIEARKGEVLATLELVDLLSPWVPVTHINQVILGIGRLKCAAREAAHSESDADVIGMAEWARGLK